jgi:soluble lytic murein transglycosylase-like protein
VSRKSNLVALSCALALGLATTTAAHAAAPELELLAKPADRLDDAIDVHKVERRYSAITDEAKDYVAKAKRLASQPAFGLAPGVSLSTLDAIAACESGGDPTAVNPAGYYGKYQFDTSTWASVGGSGSPAEASEAEQDYRASLLYSRAGSSPWPVCGQ